MTTPNSSAHRAMCAARALATNARPFNEAATRRIAGEPADPASEMHLHRPSMALRGADASWGTVNPERKLDWIVTSL